MQKFDDKPTFRQIPFSQIKERIENGDEIVLDIYSLIKSRLDVFDQEFRYFERASRVNTYEHEITSSSSEKSIGMMKNYFLFLARDQAILRRNFEDGVVKDLECYKIARGKVTSQYLGLCENAITEVDTAYTKLDAAKAHSEKLKAHLDETTEKLDALERSALELSQMSDQQRKERERELDKNVLGRMFGAFQLTPEQEKEKLLKKVNKGKYELLAANEEIATRRKELLRKVQIRDDTIDKAALEFQATEKERLERMNHFLSKFCDFEKKSMEMRKSLIQNFEDAIAEVDTALDLSSFVESKKAPELTHKYSKVLSFLDWNYDQKQPEKSSPPAILSDVTTEATLSRPRFSSAESLNGIGAAAGGGGGGSSVRSVSVGEVSSIAASLMTEMSEEPSSVADGDEVLQATLELLFPSACQDGSGPLDEEISIQVTKKHFVDVNCRENFLRFLDSVRGGSAKMSHARFRAIVAVMKEFLDACEKSMDITSALRAANMGNTFYCVNKDEEKNYIMCEVSFRCHSIWRSEKFWERALNAAIRSEIGRQECVRWDDLEQPVLTELVLSTHNLFFGQIASLAFTMHELGLEFEEVVYRVQELCKIFELSEDLCVQIYQSIQNTYERPSSSASSKARMQIETPVAVDSTNVLNPPVVNDAKVKDTGNLDGKKIESLSAFDKAMMS